jgi:hypothetical protein
MLLPNRAGRDEDEDGDGDGPRASSQRRGIHAHTPLHAKEQKQVQATVTVHRCVAGWIKYIHTYIPKAVGDTELQLAEITEFVL